MRQELRYVFSFLMGAGLALALIASTTAATADSTMSDLEFAQLSLKNCQLQRQVANTSAERAQADRCISMQTDLIKLLISASPTPSTTSANSSSPPVTSTAPPNPDLWPYPGNTGVPANWTPQQTRTTDLTITEADATVEDIRFINASLIIHASGVTVRRVEIQGGFIETSCSGTAPLRIYDSSVLKGPNQVTRFDDGPVIGPGDYNLYNVELDGVAEGIRLSEKNVCGPVRVENSFLRTLAPDNCNGDWHGDTLQGYQGPALTVVHSTIVMEGMTVSCDGTSPFFYPDQGNIRADIDGLLAVGGVYYSFRLGMPATVRGLLLVGQGIDVKCSVVESWQANWTTVDANFQPQGIGVNQPCNTEGGN